MPKLVNLDSPCMHAGNGVYLGCCRLQPSVDVKANQVDYSALALFPQKGEASEGFVSESS